MYVKCECQVPDLLLIFFFSVIAVTHASFKVLHVQRDYSGFLSGQDKISRFPPVYCVKHTGLRKILNRPPLST